MTADLAEGWRFGPAHNSAVKVGRVEYNPALIKKVSTQQGKKMNILPFPRWSFLFLLQFHPFKAIHTHKKMQGTRIAVKYSIITI